MSFENLLLWLSFMVPLILSPGPANLAISSLAGSFGLRKTMPFCYGFIGLESFCFPRDWTEF